MGPRDGMAFTGISPSRLQSEPFKASSKLEFFTVEDRKKNESTSSENNAGFLMSSTCRMHDNWTRHPKLSLDIPRWMKLKIIWRTCAHHTEQCKFRRFVLNVKTRVKIRSKMRTWGWLILIGQNDGPCDSFLMKTTSLMRCCPQLTSFEAHEVAEDCVRDN